MHQVQTGSQNALNSRGKRKYSTKCTAYYNACMVNYEQQICFTLARLFFLSKHNLGERKLNAYKDYNFCCISSKVNVEN
jgi:hypothetical protein